MKSLFNKMFILLTVLALSSAFTIAQINWIKYSGNPLLNIHGTPGSWNQSVTVPCVIFNSDLNRYEMWFTAFTGATPNPGIGLTYSSDGITWSSPTLVMTPGPASWESLFIGGVSVIKEGSLYKMWYTGALPLQIGYATSPDGINWSKYSGNPVLSPGTGWESGGVAYPSVIKVPTGYWMFYSGEVSGGVTRTGRAFSTDGINWQKDTVHNPVLLAGGSGQWDQNNFLARVIEINDSLYMCYTAEAVPGNNSTSAIGFAKSADMGITWVKDAGNPIITQGTPGNWDYGRIETGSIIYTPSELRIYYDGSGPATGNLGRIGLATAPYKLPLQPGTYTVGTNGIFATIQDAFDKLDTDGVAGNVTLELIDELYTAPTDSFGFKLNGPIPGAGPNSRVTIKPSANQNVVIEGAGRCVLYFLNTSFLTLDGVNISGSTTLTIHGLHGQQYTWKSGTEFRNNSDYNVVQNVIFIQEDINYDTDGAGFWTEWGSETTDNNIIQNNFIKRAGIGIVLAGKNQYTKATSNIIRGNNIGSETDSLITMGIGAWALQSSIIEDNIVQNLRQHFQVFGQMILTPAIELAFSNNSIIRNNVVHNCNSNSLQGSAGIWVAGDAVNGYGNDNMVYNNMVYDIQSTSTQYDSRVSGIQLWYQNNPKVFYNSVYLSGTGTNKYGSAALYITSNVTNADIKNNILVNTRDESPYCASSIYDYSSADLTSDYNDLYYDDTNNNNCLVRIGTTNYFTLADWQVIGKDSNSVTEMPNFVAPYLHIVENEETLLESRGIPITDINFDFDGQTRHVTTPDIGADEFNGIPVGVEDEANVPTEYALEQNYPNPFNPTTTFRYSIPQTSKVVIKVYDILGNEIAILIDEEKSVGTYELTWNAENVPTGVYFYQLKTGDFINSKKMILLK